jgi:hypothetical protein
MELSDVPIPRCALERSFDVSHRFSRIHGAILKLFHLAAI